MVNKSSYMIAFFAMILLAVSFASASDLTFNQTSFGSSTYNVQQGSSVTFNVLLSNTNSNYTATGIILSGASSTIADIGNKSNQTISFTIGIPSDAVLGNKVYTIYANGTLNGSIITSNTITVTLNVTQSDENKIISQICEVIDTQNISGVDKFDSDDLEDWYSFDKISLSLENINNDGEDRDSFDISLLFYQGTEDKTSDIATDKDDLKKKNLRIDENDDADIDFDFTISGDADAGNYRVYAKVIGDDSGCYVKYVGTANIEKEEGDYSIVSNVNGPVSSSCGETVDLVVTVSNIGDDDADRVKVTLYNKDLGVNIFREIDNLDEGDETLAYLSFTAPQNAVERNYKFLLYTEFDYDDDDDTYDEESDSEYDYTYTLGLSGNCVDPTKPTLSAKLNSSAIVGEDLVVAVTFKNNGNTSVSAILAPEEYESWAELVSIEPATITVGRAESKTVYMTFKPSKDGQQTFNLNAIYSGKSIDQPVTVTIESNTSLMSSIKEQFGVVGAYLIVGIIALIALIILVLIIKLIVGFARKH